MNFYQDNRITKQKIEDSKKYALSMFTEQQLACADYWNGMKGWGLFEGNDVIIRSNWNWELLYKVNQAKGIRK